MPPAQVLIGKTLQGKIVNTYVFLLIKQDFHADQPEVMTIWSYPSILAFGLSGQNKIFMPICKTFQPEIRNIFLSINFSICFGWSKQLSH